MDCYMLTHFQQAAKASGVSKMTTDMIIWNTCERVLKGRMDSEDIMEDLLDHSTALADDYYAAYMTEECSNRSLLELLSPVIAELFQKLPSMLPSLHWDIRHLEVRYDDHIFMQLEGWDDVKDEPIKLYS
jgi:hypothetical protein